MEERIEIAVRFTIEADEELNLPHYTDTLFIPLEEYETTDIEALKMERYNNWKNAVLNPPTPEIIEVIPVTNHQDLIDTVTGLKDQITALEAQITSLE